MDLKNKVKILWHHSWQNGPYDGLALLSNITDDLGERKVWFKREQNNHKNEKQETTLDSKNESKNEIENNINNDLDEINDDILEKFFSEQQNEESDIDFEKVLAKAQDNFNKILLKDKPILYSDYYNIYSLDETQIKMAEDYYNQYTTEVGFNKDHVNYKPVKLKANQDQKSFVMFNSDFNPNYMAFSCNLIGKISIHDIQNFNQTVQ